MKRSTETAKGRQSRERIEHWRKIAASEAHKNPCKSTCEIASHIQRSRAGKKWEGRLTYSIAFIVRSIRGAC